MFPTKNKISNYRSIPYGSLAATSLPLHCPWASSVNTEYSYISHTWTLTACMYFCIVYSSNLSKILFNRFFFCPSNTQHYDIRTLFISLINMHLFTVLHCHPDGVTVRALELHSKNVSTSYPYYYDCLSPLHFNIKFRMKQERAHVYTHTLLEI